MSNPKLVLKSFSPICKAKQYETFLKTNEASPFLAKSNNVKTYSDLKKNEDKDKDKEKTN